MERAEYLEAVQENPWTFPEVEGYPDPPPEWVAAAWDTEAIQESIASDMARGVSETGALLCGEAFLEGLSAVLSAEQVVRLFHTIRDESPHRESEFRPEFERGFARHAAALPPPLTRPEVIDLLQVDEQTGQPLVDGQPPTDEADGDAIPY